MKPAYVFVVFVAFAAGCSDLLRNKPQEIDFLGTWSASKIDPDVHTYLAKGKEALRGSSPPSFDIRKDGKAMVANLPTVVGYDQAVILNASGSWRLLNSPNLSQEPIWDLLIICTEPKQSVRLTFHRDRRGLYLKETFDLDYNSGIEYRRGSSK